MGSVLLLLQLIAVSLLATATNGVTITIFGTETYNGYETIHSTRNLITISCQASKSGGCVRLVHNETDMIFEHPNQQSETYTMIHVNLTGNYTCEQYATVNGNECKETNTQPVTSSDSVQVLIIDSNRINVPEWQFVYLNDSYNFVCDSDVYNLSIDHWTDVGNDAIHPGFLNNAQLSNEGQYTCTFTILNSIDKRTMNVIVLIKPEIVSHPLNQLHVAVGPSIHNYTVTYTSKSPGNASAMWYQDEVEVSEDRMIHLSHDMGGVATLLVNQRAHKGEYRLVIKSLFNGLETSQYIKDMSVVEYSFEVEIVVPPAIPIFHSVSTTPFQASILLNHTNLTADDAPDEIVLTLIDQHGSLINTVTIPGHHTQHTFIGLTPSTQYTVSISVSNIDNEMDGDSVTLTTTTTDPSVSAVSITRNSLSQFNLFLSFHYLGAPSISKIRVGYRPLGSNTAQYHYTDITDEFDDLVSLNTSGMFIVNNDVLSMKRGEFVIEITNDDDYMITTEPYSETIECLSAPSMVLVSLLTTDNTVSLIVQLPSHGTPPILETTFNFTSHTHHFSHKVAGLFLAEELIEISVGGAKGEVQLEPDTRYSVTSRSRNFCGWSQNSNTTNFTTYANEGEELVVRTTSASYDNSLPIWAIILSGVIPSITLILIIVSTVLFVLLIKKYRKRTKGYPINEITAADKNKMTSSPGESRRIKPFFSYDKPLMPRAPTSEPLEMFPYPPSSSHDDSDSETNLTQTPKYKYVVSPTHNEIGIQGFLGSTPGSGTFVYV